MEYCRRINNIISQKTSGFTNKKNIYHVQFGSVVFYRWLIKIGLMPNKSLVIRLVKVPDKFFFDFLRGYFDGDGTIYSYFDKRWKNSFMFYTGFVSGSKQFLEWVSNKIYNLTEYEANIKKCPRSYKIEYAKNATLHLIKKMYHHDDIPKLKRKYVKIIRILEINSKI